VGKYEIQQFECIGKKQNNFEVQVYDFLSHGITSNYDGVLGLNFLDNSKLTIDFTNSEIIIE